MTSHQVKQWLQEFPGMRERREKDRFLFALVLKHHGIPLTPELKAKAHDIMGDLLSADRQWRKVLEQNPELRAKDYLENKDLLEQQKMIELGYEVGYYNDLKQNDKILDR